MTVNREGGGMAAANRLEQLKQMLQDDPEDAFLRYGLAMEYRKAGEQSESLELLAGLMKDEPPHVPSFLMAAQQMVEQEEIDQARAVLRTGIETARKQGDTHAAGEMSELLAHIGELGE